MGDSGGWNTIESDAGVFTYLIEKLGVKDVQFEELLSLDATSLQQLRYASPVLLSSASLPVPAHLASPEFLHSNLRKANENNPKSPVYGVIFLFKYPTSTPYRSADPSKPLDGDFAPSASETLFFAHQSIQNACGTQALLSVLLNKDRNPSSSSTTPDLPPPSETETIDIGTTLRTFKSFTLAFPPDLRGDCLSNSSEIRDVHNSFAVSNPFIDESTKDPSAESEDVFHFIAYVPVDGTLYELDGLQPHPISHGLCPDFAEAVVPVLRRRVERYEQGEIRFNLLACVRDQRVVARERGDVEGVEVEEQRRGVWAWEGELRRANLVGLVGQVLMEVTRVVLKEGGEEGWEKWGGEGKDRTRKRVEAARKLKGGKAGGVDEMDVDV
ncbi:MAG: ubiquitin carboxyl-terminal hydrolase [Chrysothrix sp. TS-e1954]|nr:MAG: ubiquitin carboxyl-terminal hydrolase [Chrysothrix sp. TS-e1954]